MDDYAHFAASTRASPLAFAATPIDVHFAPLHRLTTAALYAAFPMRFGVAVALLVACHVAAIAVFAGFLARLRPGPAEPLLLALFAASPFTLVGLSYWTSGLHRMPFTLLCAVALLGWLRLRDEGDRRAGAGALAAFALAAGFYSKAALIPVSLAALEVSLRGRPTPLPARSRALWLAGFGCGWLGYAAAYAFHPQGYAPLTPAFVDLGETLRHAFAVLAQAPFGIVPGPGDAVAPWVPLVWLAALAGSVALARASAWVWLAWLGVIALHFAMVGLSPRAQEIGALTAYQYRYYVELALPVATGLALVCAHLPALPAAARLPRWLRHPAWALVAVAAYAGWMYTQSASLMRERYGVQRLARDYAANLTSGLAAARSGPAPLALLDGPVPRFLWVYDTSLRRLSRFVPLFGVEATWNRPAEVLHRIDSEGAVRRVRPDEAGTLRFDDLATGRYRRVRLDVDSGGCFATAADANGWVELRLPEPTLYRALVRVDARVGAPTTLRAALREIRAADPEPDAVAQVELRPGIDAVLTDLTPGGDPPALRAQALRVTLPRGAGGVCLDAVSLVPYALD